MLIKEQSKVTIYKYTVRSIVVWFSTFLNVSDVIKSREETKFSFKKLLSLQSL
jgi:hypothetical protein